MYELRMSGGGEPTQVTEVSEISEQILDAAKEWAFEEAKGSFGYGDGLWHCTVHEHFDPECVDCALEQEQQVLSRIDHWATQHSSRWIEDVTGTGVTAVRLAGTDQPLWFRLTRSA